MDVRRESSDPGSAARHPVDPVELFAKHLGQHAAATRWVDLEDGEIASAKAPRPHSLAAVAVLLFRDVGEQPLSPTDALSTEMRRQSNGISDETPDSLSESFEPMQR